MPRFLTIRDFRFINKINKELINDIIETPVLLYSISATETEENTYGEAIKKIFKRPVKLNGLIASDDPSIDSDMSAGVGESHIITVAFQREDLKEQNVYPQTGDIIKWNSGFYEIDFPKENQFVGGKVYFNHSIVCTCHLTDMTSINIEERVD